MYMYMHSSTDRVRQVNGAPTQQSVYCTLTHQQSIYTRGGRGEVNLLYIHSTLKNGLSLSFSLLRIVNVRYFLFLSECSGIFGLVLGFFF